MVFTARKMWLPDPLLEANNRIEAQICVCVCVCCAMNCFSHTQNCCSSAIFLRFGFVSLCVVHRVRLLLVYSVIYFQLKNIFPPPPGAFGKKVIYVFIRVTSALRYNRKSYTHRARRYTARDNTERINTKDTQTHALAWQQTRCA